MPVQIRTDPAEFLGHAQAADKFAEPVGRGERPDFAGEHEGIDPRAEAVQREGPEVAFFGRGTVGDHDTAGHARADLRPDVAEYRGVHDHGRMDPVHAGGGPGHFRLRPDKCPVGFDCGEIKAGASGQADLHDMIGLPAGGTGGFKINGDKPGFTDRQTFMGRQFSHAPILPPLATSASAGLPDGRFAGVIVPQVRSTAHAPPFSTMSSLSPSPRIGLFGGSFDPVHCGHLAIATEAVRVAGLDRVVFLPTRESPHKPGWAAGANAAQRVEMLRLATRDLPWAEVSDWELLQPPPSYSWKTAGHFHACHPDASLYWLLGADQWAVIESWSKPEVLRELLHFVVFPREPHPLELPRAGWRCLRLHGEHPASSTGIRTDLVAGAGMHPHLPEAVARYVHANNLYGTSSDGL